MTAGNLYQQVEVDVFAQAAEESDHRLGETGHVLRHYGRRIGSTGENFEVHAVTRQIGVGIARLQTLQDAFRGSETDVGFTDQFVFQRRDAAAVEVDELGPGVDAVVNHHRLVQLSDHVDGAGKESP